MSEPEPATSSRRTPSASDPALGYADDVPLYRAVADQVEGWIQDGTLTPGTRIPSLRKLSRQFGVSISTVMEAYRVLEDRGVVEVRPQSGHYVRLTPRSSPPIPERTATCDQSAPLDAIDLIEQLLREASRQDLSVPLGAAVPAAEFLPTGRLNTLLARAVRREPIISQSYDSLPGRPELRTEIARRALESGCSLPADDIVITTGAQEAISLALRAVTRPGDAVAIESPTYHGFLQALEAQHLKAREISTCSRDGICLEGLEQAFDDGVAACMLVPSHGNPLGHCMSAADRGALLTLLRRFDVPLIEDDTYGELYFADRRPQTVKALDDEGRVLLLSSFSKMLAPGLRVGWIAPGRYRKDVLRHKFSSSLATATPTQMAVAEYLASGGFDRHLRKLRATFKDLVRRMIGAVGENFPAGTRVTRPAGGYVIWLELPPGVDSMRLHRDALAEGISLSPGPIFSASGRYRHCIRLNCAVSWSDAVDDAVRRLGELVRAQMNGGATDA